MELSESEAQAFLARPQVATIAIEHPGHAPLAVPIWYSYEPGGDVRIVTPPDSVKARLLRAAGRCSFVVDVVDPAPAYVSVECELVSEGDVSREAMAEMAARYLPAEAVDGFVGSLPPEAPFVLRPTRWRAVDLGR